MEFVMALCTRLIVLAEGRTSPRAPAEVRANPAVIEAYLGTDMAERSDPHPRERRCRLRPDDDPERRLATIRRGAITTVIGPNGAGSRPLFKTAFGLWGPLGHGHVRRRRHHQLRASPHARCRHVLRAAGPQPLPELSVRHNLELGGVALTDTRARCPHGRHDGSLPDAPGEGRRPGSTLSGGQQKFLEVAPRFVLNPTLMSIDGHRWPLAADGPGSLILKGLREPASPPADRAEPSPPAPSPVHRPRPGAGPDPHRGHRRQHPGRSAHRPALPGRRTGPSDIGDIAMTSRMLRHEMEALHDGKTGSGRKVTSGLRKPKS